MDSLPVDLGPIDDPGFGQLGSRIATRCADLLAESSVVQAIEANPGGKRLLANAAEVSVPEHAAWLQGCLADFLPLGAGANRASTEKRFRSEGGISWAEKDSFYHCECLYLQVDLSFELAAPGGLVSSPMDRAVGVGSIELDLIRAD